MASRLLVVIGADEDNLELIRSIPDLEDFDVVPVLTREDVQPQSETIDFDQLYGRAKTAIEETGRTPDALIGYLDFPVTSLVALLRRDFGLPGASPEAVATCEHKYWMRKVQKRIAPDRTPRVAALNPFAPEEARAGAPPYPYWLKPIKGHSSVLGFKIEHAEELNEALHECRRKIHLFGNPFNQFLRHVDVPEDIRPYDGNFAIAEEMISAARQFTLEGYVHDGETVVYGAVDSVRAGKHNTSFSRYQYPADLSEQLVERCREETAALLDAIGYDGSPFNVEFFWDPETDRLALLEINPRISKSHSPLFAMVDGVSHHKVAIDLSMGKRPEIPHRKGPDRIAAKFMLRSFEPDGMIRTMPTQREIEELRRILPDVKVEVIARENTRLSDMPYQDSYSYELADVFLGGSDTEMLKDAYARCVDSLSVTIKPLPERL